MKQTPAVSLDLASNTDAVALPTGTTAQRPSGTDAYIRKNSTNNALEFYNGTSLGRDNHGLFPNWFYYFRLR
jgi:hypothetical protein